MRTECRINARSDELWACFELFFELIKEGSDISVFEQEE
jgi:hypothetical protein